MLTITKPCPSCGTKTAPDHANDNGLCCACMGMEQPQAKTFHIHQYHTYIQAYEVVATSEVEAFDKFIHGQAARTGDPQFMETNRSLGLSLDRAVKRFGEAIATCSNHYVIWKDRLASIADIRVVAK